MRSSKSQWPRVGPAVTEGVPGPVATAASRAGGQTNDDEGGGAIGRVVRTSPMMPNGSKTSHHRDLRNDEQGPIQQRPSESGAGWSPILTVALGFPLSEELQTARPA
jgi:hypothetical protein